MAGDFTIGTENTFCAQGGVVRRNLPGLLPHDRRHRVRRHRGRRGDRHLGRLRDRIRAHLARAARQPPASCPTAASSTTPCRAT
ncbi:MAG: hypothetical protein ACLTDR_11775 [Adlercreutzia equolifaciens]